MKKKYVIQGNCHGVWKDTSLCGGTLTKFDTERAAFVKALSLAYINHIEYRVVEREFKQVDTVIV